MAFARDPEAFGDLVRVEHRGMRCPVCRFPTYGFEPDPERLPADVIALVREDFPDWHPARGICPQCADLYRARPLSVSELALLPKA